MGKSLTMSTNDIEREIEEVSKRFGSLKGVKP